jgi:hypothetical protein
MSCAILGNGEYLRLYQSLLDADIKKRISLGHQMAWRQPHQEQHNHSAGPSRWGYMLIGAFHNTKVAAIDSLTKL